MTGARGEPDSPVADQVRRLLDSGPLEEEIHQFLAEHVFRIGQGNPHSGGRIIGGAISKFPIAPDRIPDFTVARLRLGLVQAPSGVVFIELKKPDARLYTANGRMSKDLNDAWMECVESARLMADNYRDCIRRIVKSLAVGQFDEYDRTVDDEMPRCTSVIIIGRRSSLDDENVRRTRELSAATKGAICVITYDTLLDWVEEGRDSLWSNSWF